MAQITYTNKEALNENPEIANINKVTDDDMNEIKQVVNDNYNYTIQITTTEPTDDDGKLWINPDDVLVRQDNIVKTTYNESDDNTYSTNYINNVLEWKTLATNVTPTTPTNLPDNFNEINIQIRFVDKYVSCFIPKSSLSSTTKGFRQGNYFASTNYYGTDVEINVNQIVSASGQGSGGTANDYDVYYR